MTEYWVLMLLVLTAAAIILLVVLNRPKKDTTVGERKEPPVTPKPPVKPGDTGVKKPEIKTATMKKPVEKKPVDKKPQAEAKVVVKPHTTVYEYTPTRGVIRCRVCDGENTHGSVACGICGNYLTY